MLNNSKLKLGEFENVFSLLPFICRIIEGVAMLNSISVSREGSAAQQVNRATVTTAESGPCSELPWQNFKV
jgi:hypothetical protein